MPPCMGEADRFSLEALRHIHKQLDDDNDGGIEVNESVEVSCVTFYDFGRKGDSQVHRVRLRRTQDNAPEAKPVTF